MIDVISSSFHLKTPHFDQDDFKSYSTELFDKWDQEIEKSLRLSDYSLVLIVEEGSVKGYGKVVVTIALVYKLISGYGAFRTGVMALSADATYISENLFSNAKTTFRASDTRGNTKRTEGEAVYLRMMFERVEAGEITVDEAMEEVKTRYGEEVEELPSFLLELETSLKEAPRRPEQLTLENDDWQKSSETVSVEKPRSRTEKPRKPEPKPPPDHYRIEITRDSRRRDKRVKLTKVK